MIGTLNESSLHASLKQIFKEPGDKIEKRIDKYMIDLVRKDLLIEIQTINFSAIKRKIESLMKNHRVLLIYPIIRDNWIINLEPKHNTIIRKRLSPQHGSFLNIFKELIYIPNLLSNPNLIIEALLIQIEEIRVKDNSGSWKRNGWSIYDRKLLKILERKIFSHPEQLLNFIPMNLKNPFTNQALADSLDISIKLAQMMTYTLKKMDLLTIIGKYGKKYVFKIKLS